MKKLAIRLAIAAAIATSGTISNVAFADTTPKNGATQGLKHGTKNGAKVGLKNGKKKSR